MKADLFPDLTNIERDLDNPFSTPKGPWWGRGEDVRNSQIQAAISSCARKLQSSSIDDLSAYAEALKPHLKRAMDYMGGGCWSDYERCIAYCHTQLSFSYFALLIREYDRKKLAINLVDYAYAAGLVDYALLSTEVCNAADNWLIIHTPTIASLLAGTRQSGRKQTYPKEYDLLADYPRAVVYLKRVTPEYLNDNYSLRISTSKSKASVIAYTIASELKIREYCKYFEKFWDLNECLRDALRRARQKGNKEGIRHILQMLLRKKITGMNKETVDANKVEEYMGKFTV